jgi:hypothetical protein
MSASGDISTPRALQGIRPDEAEDIMNDLGRVSDGVVYAQRIGDLPADPAHHVA